jgi:intein-encoded DNA endonuclease-like protein
MIVMLCRNKVVDFQKWKTVLDSHSQAHKAAGMRLRDLWRDVDDARNVFFVFEVASVDQARAFINDPAEIAAGKSAGVLEGEYHFLESAPRY